jgi:hydrogenase nickel incorporation protein HypA/HybF
MRSFHSTRAMIEEAPGTPMHEMSIAASMLEAVQEESARRNAHVLAVGVKIGALSGVDSESLRFCFDALVRDTDLAPLSLEVEALPWRHRCRHCAQDFAVENYRTECPRCSSPETEMAGGSELEFAYMEIDET